MVERRDRLGQRPALDGLRGIAVIAVVASHYFAGVVPNGAIGVDMFFVLSGFLITTLLLEERSRTDLVSLRRFWLRRALRLLPAATAVLTADLVIHVAFRGWAGLRIGLHAISGPAAYVANWRYIGGHGFDELSPMWSLSVEEQFYFLWPLTLVALLRSRLSLRRLSVLVASAALASWAWEVRLWTLTHDWTRVYVGTDTRAYGLLAGCAIALARFAGPDELLRHRKREVTIAGFVAMTALTFVSFGTQRTALFTGGNAVVTLAICALLIAVLQGGILSTILSARWLKAIGVVSYGVYLWHYLILIVLPLTPLPLDARGVQVLGLALTALLSVLSYLVVELPFLRLKARFGTRESTPSVLPAPGAAGASALEDTPVRGGRRPHDPLEVLA